MATNNIFQWISKTFLRGLVAILPIYLAVLAFNQMLKALEGLIIQLLKPIASIIPVDKNQIAIILALLVFILICLIAGIIIKTSYGLIIKKAVEPTLKKIPGYSLIRSITKRVVHLEETQELGVAFVALGETNQALSPAFLMEKHEDGSYTVFVPVVPTPTVGNLYIIPENRVFPIDVTLLQMVKFISKWGENSSELVQALKKVKPI